MNTNSGLAHRHAFPFQLGRTEVQKDSDLFAGRFEVIQQLGLLYIGQFLDRFDLT